LKETKHSKINKLNTPQIGAVTGQQTYVSVFNINKLTSSDRRRDGPADVCVLLQQLVKGWGSAWSGSIFLLSRGWGSAWSGSLFLLSRHILRVFLLSRHRISFRALTSKSLSLIVILAAGSGWLHVLRNGFNLGVGKLHA
jgi:hypothetical protein